MYAVLPTTNPRDARTGYMFAKAVTASGSRGAVCKHPFLQYPLLGHFQSPVCTTHPALSIQKQGWREGGQVLLHPHILTMKMGGGREREMSRDREDPKSSLVPSSCRLLLLVCDARCDCVTPM